MPSGAIERFRLVDVLPEPISHYTDAVRAGETLWVSGLMAVDPDGAIVGGNDPVAQTERIFEILAKILQRVNATFADVVKVTVYLRHMSDRVAINAVRERYFGEARPASTLVEVNALAAPDALVEIDAFVYAPLD
jgi:2-iminobutanoate/2-iminopropanoate deaminase